MKTIVKGNGSPVIAIIGCVHGNEKLGKETIDAMQDILIKKGTVKFILANIDAMNSNKRGIDADLNRVFPGKKSGNHEEKLAVKLKCELSDCDYVIDIHSTTADTESFNVITKMDESILDMIRFFLLKKTVFMEPVIAQGKSLIDNVKCGVSIEFNENYNKMDVRNGILNFMKHIGMVDGKSVVFDQEIYSVYGILEKYENGPEVLSNFLKMSLCNEEFYPVLSGEVAYNKVLCMKAKKL